MSGQPILSVRGLSKKYSGGLNQSLRYGLLDIGRELLPGRVAPAGLRPGEFWALDDLSFDLGRGEALAVIGRNGAGKSTLLKTLAGLLKPDRGEIRIMGRAEAIIELGTGFNPLLSGRENVALGAALHGLSRREARLLLDEVVDFAELGGFIDSALLAYSSGMKARLAYALAAHLKPDVLLVDEALAVGDIAFQHKCVTHMREFLKEGGSLLLVSHYVHQIQSVCTRGILLERGRLSFDGSAVEALNHMFETRFDGDPGQAPAAIASGPVRIDAVAVRPVKGETLRTGEEVRVTLGYEAEEAMEALWSFHIWTSDLWTCIASAFDRKPHRLGPGAGELACVIPRLPLVGGRYILRAAILRPSDLHPLALFGDGERGLVVDVYSPADEFSNLQMQREQLMVLDVEFAEPRAE